MSTHPTFTLALDGEAKMAPHLSVTAAQTGVRGAELRLPDLSPLSPTAPMSTSLFRLAAGCETPDDSHAVHEIWMVAAGRLSIVYDGDRYDATVGDALYFRPFKAHRAENPATEEAVVVSIWWP